MSSLCFLAFLAVSVAVVHVVDVALTGHSNIAVSHGASPIASGKLPSQVQGKPQTLPSGGRMGTYGSQTARQGWTQRRGQGFLFGNQVPATIQAPWRRPRRNNFIQQLYYWRMMDGLFDLW